MVEATSKFQNLLKIGMLVWGNLGKDYKDEKKQKQSKIDKKREKDKESRARVRNQPEITAGSARHSRKDSQRKKQESQSLN
ncbi:hypothetical protein Tco_0313053 [Tanacetum coccineum]